MAVSFANKISRASTKAVQAGIRAAKQVGNKALASVDDVYKFLKKEIEHLVQAIKDGKFIEYLREKLFKMFGVGKKAELKLKGEVIVLKGFRWERIRYVKRPRAEYQKLLKESRKAKQDFIEDLMKKPYIKDKLKESGISEIEIKDLQNGIKPDGWHVHHKTPIDDGGTNDFKNLMLIKNESYHKAITVYQNSFSNKMKDLEIIEIEFPIYNGFLYP